MTLPRRVLSWLPLRRTLAGYRREWLPMDVIAGLSVCTVMVPSVVAYAGLAGLPPVTGLYAALAGMIGYGLFASSRRVITGPDAALTLLVGVAITPIAGGDPQRAAVLAAALAILAGAILLVTAAVRAGVFAELLSKPVLVGYLTGAALILISTQLGKFVGLKVDASEFFPVIAELWQRRGEFHGPTMWAGVGLVALLAALRVLLPRAPGALIAFLLALTASWLLDLEAMGFALVGAVPAGLPNPRLPLIDIADLGLLLPGAAAVALLAMPEGILLARAFAARRGETINANQEIASLGVANLCAGVLQGFAVGASQSRTTVNDAAGGQTPLAGFVAAAGLVVILLWLTPLLAMLPTVTLAAILIVAGLQLIDLGEYRSMLRFDWKAGVLAILVLAGVLLAGVLQGIMLGVALSLIHLLVGLARPLDAVLREIPGRRRYHDLSEDDEAPPETVPGLIAYRFYAPLLFANAEWFVGRVRELIERSPTPVRWFVLDAQAIWSIDLTAMESLQRLVSELQARGISFKVARANRPLREVMRRSGVTALIGERNFYPSVHAAVNEFRGPEARPES